MAKRGAGGKGKAAFAPGERGVAPDKGSPAYIQQMAEARRGLPEFADITYLEAVLYDNGATGRPRGQPRYRIGLHWTCAPPVLVDKSLGRTMTRRTVPLAEREQARDNWNRKGKRQGMFRFDPEEREVADAIMGQARADNRKGDGRPPALMGCVQNHFDKGTIRHSQFGLVLWRPEGGAWLPDLFLYRVYPVPDVLSSRDPLTGERRPWVRMRPGKGAKVVAYGEHHGEEFWRYLRPAWLDAAVAENLRGRESKDP